MTAWPGVRGCLLLLAMTSCGKCAPDRVPDGEVSAPAGAFDFEPRPGAIELPATAVATGTPHWFGTLPDEPLLNARVDLGTLRVAVGGAIEVTTEWPLTPGAKIDARLSGKDLPDGTRIFERTRVVCTPRGPLTYLVETFKLGPDGRDIERRSYDAAAERRKKEAPPLAPSEWGSFGPNAASLVCLAVARKCKHKSTSWPPPANTTPLEHSPAADGMRAAYNAAFVPSCKLGT